MSSYYSGTYQPKNTQKYIGKKLPTYRSGWELSFMRMADNHPNVIAWGSEGYRIPYVNPITGKKSTYVPDFFIVYVDKNGKKHAEVVEVKPSSQIVGNAKGTYDRAQAVINESKWKYAKQWCDQQGVGFRIITENEIYQRATNPKPQRNPRKSRKKK